MKKKFLRVLLFLSLISSLGFTAPLYVDCQDLDPDEWLDLFGITQSITALKLIFTDQLPVFPDLIPDGHIFRRHHSGSLSVHPFTSGPALSVALRC